VVKAALLVSTLLFDFGSRGWCRQGQENRSLRNGSRAKRATFKYDGRALPGLFSRQPSLPIMSISFTEDLLADSRLEGAMSEPDLPDLRDLPVLNEMFDFNGASQTSERSQSVVASQHDLAQSVPPSSNRGRSESHIPWASAVVEDLPSDDEDGLFADGLGPVSDEELDEAEPASTEKPRYLYLGHSISRS
jgi:hypothetical protein